MPGFLDSKFSAKFYLALIFAYPIIFVWQGLDFTDMGLWITGYQQFLSHPEGSASNLLVNWASYAICYWVTWLTDDYGVVAFNLAYVIVLWLTMGITYKALKSICDKEENTFLLLLIFATMVYIDKSAGNFIAPNNLTALFCTAGVTLLYFGLLNSSKFLIGMAGLVIGINIFIRLPNALGASLGLAIFLYGWAERTPFRIQLKQCIAYLSGLFLAVFVTFYLIKIADHLEYFQSGLDWLLRMSSAEKSHHNLGHLLNRLILDHALALLTAIFMAVTGYRFCKWGHSVATPKGKSALFIGLLLAVILLPLVDSWRWIVPGLCYIILVPSVFFNFGKDNKLMLLSFVSIALVFIVPLGSNNGIYNAIFGSWLALPLSIMMLGKTGHLKWRHYKLDRCEVRFCVALVLSALLAFSFATKLTHTYRDSSNRFDMTHTIDHPLLRGVFTTAARAKVVQEVLDELEKHVKKGDSMLAYNEIPTLHYLTNTVPWLNIPWPLLKSPNTTRRLLQEKENAGENMPVIVRAMGSTHTQTWPLADRTLDTSIRQDEGRIVFSEFEKRHGYRVVWQNDFFEILRSEAYEWKRSRDE